MGREIVRQESREDPEECSRLWCPEDIIEVLQEKTGTNKTEVLHLDSWSEVKWDGEAFRGTTKLRTLIITYGCYLSTSPKYLPNTLKVFIWSNYPSPYLPSDFYPKKLVLCKLSNTTLHLQDLFKKGNEFKSMRILDLSRNEYLRKIPDISGLPNLEEFKFSHCHNLITVDDSVGLLGKLKTLRATYCKKLKTFPPLSLNSLELLDISNCESLESFPLVVGRLLDKLKILRAKGCKKLKIFPTLNLASLEELDISDCEILESFPPLIGGSLDKLKILNTRSCEKLRSFPLLNLASLEKLDISNCVILESFPPVIDGLLDKLKILYAGNCRKLKSFPSLKLPSLEQLHITSCESLESFPLLEDGDLGRLNALYLTCCKMIQQLPPLKLPSLEKLDLSYCERLEGFPETLIQMENIRGLHLWKTPIKELPFSFRNFCGLESLFLGGCGDVQFPSSIVEMSKLTKIEIHDGGWLFPRQEKGGENVSLSLKSLRLFNCNLSDESLEIGLKWFANIETLDLTWSKFTTLPQCIENCQFLWKLIIDYCEELEKLEGIPPSIEVLFAQYCTSLSLSSKSKLLNQELHKVRNTWFCLPTREVPKWFEHKCVRGESFSFWFRNKFPAIVLCHITELQLTSNDQGHGKVIINGTTTHLFGNRDNPLLFYGKNLQHLFLFHLQPEKIIDNLGEALLENKWIHAEVHLTVLFLDMGIHVLKEKSSMDDIRFTKPENDDDAPSSIDSDVDIRKQSNDENSDLRGEAVTCLELVKPVESLPSEMTLMTKSEPVEPEETSGSGNSAVEYSIDSVKAVASVSETERVLNSDVGTVLLEQSVVLPLEAANLTGMTTEDNIYPLADENATTSTLEENQPRVTSAPIMVQKTSWWSCCGLFEILRFR